MLALDNFLGYINSIMTMNSAIEALASRIERSGISKRRLAREAGIADSTLRRILAGRVSPTMRTLGKIGDVLDLEERTAKKG